MHLAILWGLGDVRFSLLVTCAAAADNKLEMLLVYTWCPRFLSTWLLYWEETYLHSTMYWLPLASKSSARSECAVNILLLQDVFYCLPLKMFEHFLKSALNAGCHWLEWKGKICIAETVNDYFCWLLNGVTDKSDCFDSCSCADAP